MKITTSRLADEVVREFGREISLKQYEVRVDGKRIGVVAQHRADTAHGLAGQMLARMTTRTAWSWLTDDDCGDYEIGTRKQAVDDLVAFAVDCG